jgi:hypothetical protein
MQRPHLPRAAHARPAVSWRKIRAALHSETSAFFAGSASLIVVPLGLIWVMLDSDGRSIGVPGLVTVVLGTVGASVLATALIAALFRPDRSGHDSRVGGKRRDGP